MVPLDGSRFWRGVEIRARVVPSSAPPPDPKHLTQEFSKADRGGRILGDTGRTLQRDVCRTSLARAARRDPGSAP